MYIIFSIYAFTCTVQFNKAIIIPIFSKHNFANTSPLRKMTSFLCTHLGKLWNKTIVLYLESKNIAYVKLSLILSISSTEYLHIFKT